MYPFQYWDFLWDTTTTDDESDDLISDTTTTDDESDEELIEVLDIFSCLDIILKLKNLVWQRKRIQNKRKLLLRK